MRPILSVIATHKQLLTFGRHLQDDTPDIETRGPPGPPITYSVRGTHGRKSAQWVFPDPEMYPELTHSSIQVVQRQEIVNRFKAVRDGLEKELVRQTKGILRYLRRKDSKSDSDSSDIYGEYPPMEDPIQYRRPGTGYQELLGELKAEWR